MASKKQPFQSNVHFALHAVKRMIYIWLIVALVATALYWNGGLAHFLADLVAGHGDGKETTIFHDFLTCVFFLLVPASLILGASWADEDDRPEAKPEKDSDRGV